MRARGTPTAGDPHFTWRGVSVSRLENLSDIVFGFSVTLLVVSLEVPASFGELARAFWQMPAFAVCFYILSLCWYYNYEFHRRFGLQDFKTVVLTVIQLFLVLFYVYPLKFFFSWLSELFINPAGASVRMSDQDVPAILALYGVGWFGIFLLFALLYRNALKLSDDLGMTESERLVARLRGRAHLVVGLVGLASVLVALLAAGLSSWALLNAAGLVYLLIGPLNWWNKRELRRRLAHPLEGSFVHGDGI